MRTTRLISNRGSALLVALVISILLSILAISFLEKVTRLSRTSAGIENSAGAYTLATGLIEQQLMSTQMTKKEPWKIPVLKEGNSNFGGTGRELTAQTGGTNMPVSGFGNSPFDRDWNVIGLGNPVQIVIDNNISDWNNVQFQFRVPKGLGQGNTGSTAATTNSGVILWTFGYSGASLYASGETNIFKGNDISGNVKNISSFIGFTNLQQTTNFLNFYNTIKNSCTNYNCTLKLSMVRPFQTLDNQTFSLLEYRIVFPSTIPSQYMVIDSTAYIRGYLRSRQVRIPQITTSTAVEFVVLQ